MVLGISTSLEHSIIPNASVLVLIPYSTKEEMFLLLIAATSVCFGCAAVVESPSIEKHHNTVEGTAPPYIKILRGRDGRDGRDGEPGP